MIEVMGIVTVGGVPFPVTTEIILPDGIAPPGRSLISRIIHPRGEDHA